MVRGIVRRRFGVDIGRQLFASLHETVGPGFAFSSRAAPRSSPELAWNLQALGWTVTTGYGLTETAPLLTICMPETGRLDRAGKPIEGVEVRIDHAALAERGGETGADVPDGADDSARRGGSELGEVLARGPNVFSGYLNLPEETARAIDADGWFHTGDLGAFDGDGNLMLSGRLSTMIVTEGGKNVHPEDVEEAYQASPLIREIVVLERDHRLAGLIVPETKALPGGGDPGAAREAVGRALQEISRKLPSYQRIGDFALTTETLPRTRLGKPRRHLLGERYDKAARGEAPTAERKEPVAIEQMTAEDRTLLEDDAVRAAWGWLAEKFPETRSSPTATSSSISVSTRWNGSISPWKSPSAPGSSSTRAQSRRIETVRDLLVEVGQGADLGRRSQSPAGGPRGVGPRVRSPLDRAAVAGSDPGRAGLFCHQRLYHEAAVPP